MAAAVLARLEPQGVPAPPPQVSVELARIGGQSWAGRGPEVARLVRTAAWLVPGTALVCLVGGVLLARDRRRAGLAADSGASYL